MSKLSDRLDDVTRELEEAKRKLSIGKTDVPALTYAFVTFTVKNYPGLFFSGGRAAGFQSQAGSLACMFPHLHAINFSVSPLV